MFLMKEKILNEGGGWGLCVRDNDADADALLMHGELIIITKDNPVQSPPTCLLPLVSNPNDCHNNSTMLHQLTNGVFQYHTGYYMTEDFLWKQHSWTVNRHTKCIVDTAGVQLRSLQYYGIDRPPCSGTLGAGEEKQMDFYMKKLRERFNLCTVCFAQTAGHDGSCEQEA